MLSRAQQDSMVEHLETLGGSQLSCRCLSAYILTILRRPFSIYVAIDGQLAGFAGIADPIKATTREAIQQLRAEGIRVVMLTGDGGTTAEAVGAQLGIDEVMAEVLPADKSR